MEYLQLAAPGRGCVKTRKNSVHIKTGLSKRPLPDFLDIGNGHPTRENFMFLRFYTASAVCGLCEFANVGIVMVDVLILSDKECRAS
jgi:hypothetical protein